MDTYFVILIDSWLRRYLRFARYSNSTNINQYREANITK